MSNLKMDFSSVRKHILWLDGGAALVVGTAVVLLQDFLVKLYQMPSDLVLFLGIANLTYAAYSLTLASREQKHLNAIRILVTGNAIWVFACLIIIYNQIPSASIIGLLFVASEAVFVAALAYFEWQWRYILTGDTSDSRELTDEA
ncbi:conserved hypothetical protein [Vibrio nigripulchritudo SFn118]|nr:conserved hypothetical protein [Vibrio nigripulchritudo SFn118]